MPNYLMIDKVYQEKKVVEIATKVVEIATKVVEIATLFRVNRGYRINIINSEKGAAALYRSALSFCL